MQQADEIVDPDDQGATSLLTKVGDSYWHLDYARSMVSLLTAMERPEDALPYYQVALTLSERRFEADKVKAVANADVMFQLREKDRDMELLRLQAFVADLDLRQSRNQTLIGVLVASLAGLVAFFLFRSYRAQRKLAHTKDIFLSEIHHRTKNNLQLLSSLLSIDARRSQAIAALGTRQDTANRARTMVLVHDHIYNQPDTSSTRIDIKPFLDDLISLLSESLERGNIRLKDDIASVLVDVDRLTPLSLIVCELVSNAYKHAFDDKGGAICIALEGEPGTLVLTVRDDGSGFNMDLARNKKGSLGLTLIDDLSEQIDGKIDVMSGPEGTLWTLSNIVARDQAASH